MAQQRTVYRICGSAGLSQCANGFAIITDQPYGLVFGMLLRQRME